MDAFSNMKYIRLLGVSNRAGQFNTFVIKLCLTCNIIRDIILMKGEGKHQKTRKELRMYINEETAQLILDAIAWSNKDWKETLNWTNLDRDAGVEEARIDFVRFCRVRGIEGVEKVVEI